tara:strand:+ start:235 stop:438 length:204 start_codon:yes stop_codon:yes gene_type:complete
MKLYKRFCKMKDGQLYYIPILLPPYFTKHSWGVDSWQDRHAKKGNIVCTSEEDAVKLSQELLNFKEE